MKNIVNAFKGKTQVFFAYFLSKKKVGQFI